MQHQTVIYATGEGWHAPLPSWLDSPQTLVMAFGAPDLEAGEHPYAELAAAFPSAVLMGCSTAGEIAGTAVHDASISVAVARFEHSRLRRVLTRIGCPADSQAAGARLAAQLLAPPAAGDLRAVFVLSVGLNVNGTPLVAGLASGLPPGVVITGGLAGDGNRFAATWVLDRERRETQHVCAVGLYGERLRVGHGCHAGWLDFGPDRLITRSQGNVLYELDGKPALELYRTYLGDRAQGLPGTALLFPLALRQQVGDAEPVVRTILAIDEAANSLTFAGDMPQGAVARLMRASNDKLISSAGVASRQAVAALPPLDDALLISVSCVGRRLVLGERTEEEVEAVLEGTPRRTSHIGFYSYGEISPTLPGRASELHNQTMTVTAYAEA